MYHIIKWPVTTAVVANAAKEKTYFMKMSMIQVAKRKINESETLFLVPIVAVVFGKWHFIRAYVLLFLKGNNNICVQNF